VSLQDSAALLSPGQTINGEYQVDALHERRTPWAVYRAHHKLRKRDEVRILTLCDREADERYRDALTRYAEWLKSARVLGMPAYVASGTENALPYVMTSWVEGPTLATFLQTNPAPSQDLLLSILRVIAESLDVMHARRPGIVHHVLSPHSIVLEGATSHPRLLECGFAHALRQAKLADIGLYSKIEGLLLAPEDDPAKVPGPAVDRYALAKLAEMMFGSVAVGSAPHRVLQRAASAVVATRFASCSSFVQALTIALRDPNAVSATMSATPPSTIASDTPSEKLLEPAMVPSDLPAPSRAELPAPKKNVPLPGRVGATSRVGQNPSLGSVKPPLPVPSSTPKSARALPMPSSLRPTAADAIGPSSFVSKKADTPDPMLEASDSWADIDLLGELGGSTVRTSATVDSQIHDEPELQLDDDGDEPSMLEMLDVVTLDAVGEGGQDRSAKAAVVASEAVLPVQSDVPRLGGPIPTPSMEFSASTLVDLPTEQDVDLMFASLEDDAPEIETVVVDQDEDVELPSLSTPSSTANSTQTEQIAQPAVAVSVTSMPAPSARFDAAPTAKVGEAAGVSTTKPTAGPTAPQTLETDDSSDDVEVELQIDEPSVLTLESPSVAAVDELERRFGIPEMRENARVPDVPPLFEVALEPPAAIEPIAIRPAKTETKSLRRRWFSGSFVLVSLCGLVVGAALMVALNQTFHLLGPGPVDVRPEPPSQRLAVAAAVDVPVGVEQAPQLTAGQDFAVRDDVLHGSAVTAIEGGDVFDHAMADSAVELIVVPDRDSAAITPSADTLQADGWSEPAMSDTDGAVLVAGSAGLSQPDWHIRGAARATVRRLVEPCGHGVHHVARFFVRFAGTTGAVESVTVVGRVFENTPLGACVERAVRRLQLPPFRQAHWDTDYAVALR
jgi:hypothetical protein